MAKIVVYTDSGEKVAEMDTDAKWSDNARSRLIIGTQYGIHGWLGRALRDAEIMQEGGDPERPSEKVMRMMSERKEQ